MFNWLNHFFSDFKKKKNKNVIPTISSAVKSSPCCVLGNDFSLHPFSTPGWFPASAAADHKSAFRN